MSKLMAGLAVAGGLMGFVVGFGGGCGEAKTAFDCQEVCQRYHDCFDGDYDVGACRSRCRANAESDQTYENKANACASCIGDRSCIGDTFHCATECAGVVPN